MKFWALILSCFLMGHFVRADDDFSIETFKATRLSSTIYMLEGAGGNVTASIGADGTFLVDCDFSEMSDKLLLQLKELGGASPRFIVNTHFHYDHTGANQVFGKTATIIAASAVRARLMTQQVLWHKIHEPALPIALPQITFDQSLFIHLNNDEIEVLHLPRGHTDGDSVVFFKDSKIVSMGDLYFSGMFPIFHPEHGGSIEGYLKNIEFILAQTPDDAKVIPGHGPLSNKTELKTYYKMILASIEVVRKGIRQGHSLEDIKKAGLTKEWEPFSHGYLSTDQWLESIFKNIR